MNLTASEVAAIKSIHDQMVGNPIKRFTIKELIVSSGLSESKLTKGFKLLFNDSIYHFHLSKSMHHARILLASGMQAKEVRIALGYSTASNFSRAYFKVFGVHPSDDQCKNNASTVSEP